MSADNWAVCPVCYEKLMSDKEAEMQRVATAYGKVPVEEFDAMRKEAHKPIEEPVTFREDYEFYLDGTNVRVSYSGFCSTCGSGLSFQDSRPIIIKKLS